jgi:predicted transcriptional regulator
MNIRDMSLTALDQKILVDLLIHEDDKAGNIGDRVGSHRNSVSNRLQSLRAEGYCQRKGEAVHELTDQGRDFARSYSRSHLDIYESD